jgi:hypothetical protein
MATPENIATLSSAFRQLSEALHVASVACKDLEYTLPLLAASKAGSVGSPTAIEVPTQESKTPKGIKDPNEPRRPATAYLLYQKEARHKLIEESPQLKPPEIMVKLASQWNNLSEAAKRV